MAIIQFSNSTTKAGIIEQIGKRTGTQNASSTAYSLAEKTVDVNMALANFFMLATKATGRWQVDDSNFLDYPIIYTNIVAGQQDYSVTEDETGNQVTDIWKIRIQYPDGSWKTLSQRDINDGMDDDEWMNSNQTGLPTEFDLNADGIFLNAIPNYDLGNGLEVYVSRTGSYFVSTDTTKAAGIPDIFQEYLIIRPSYLYCLDKALPRATQLGYILFGRDGKSGMEKAIQDYYASRNRTEKPRFRPARQNNR